MSEYNSDTGAGWMCYDAACPFCVRWTNRARGTLESRGFVIIPLQSDWARRALKVPEADLLREMRVVTLQGEVFGGADALLYLARRIAWAWPLWALASVPGVKPLVGAVYRIIAANRTCAGNACRVPNLTVPTATRISIRTNTVTWIDTLPLFGLTGLGIALGQFLPPWIWMWTIAFALFAGCKWLTFRLAVHRGLITKGSRAVGYLFAWPGMDARAFLPDTPIATKPTLAAWLRSGVNVVIGAALLLTAPRWLLDKTPLLAGWAGMVGVVLILHFGLFDVLALAWRRAGVNAVPLMRNPMHSYSLAEFWSRRWNTGFHQLAHDFIFRPLHGRLGARGATALVFAVSGLIHELVISVPARGGYGFPTFYFLLQGAGVLFERTGWGRRFGLGRGARGWLFTITVTIAPAVWVFHPPFIRHVILPMLRAIGAT